MATTEMDSERSEPGSVDGDSKYPLKVLYCGGTVLLLVPFSIVRAVFFLFCFDNEYVPLSSVCSLPTEVDKDCQTQINNKFVNAKVCIVIFLFILYCFVHSIVSTCPSQPNVGNGLRRTFLMFLPG